VSEVLAQLKTISNDLFYMMESYSGNFRSRVNYNPDDINRIIVDLIKVRNEWEKELS
jgi:bisphosphoglycerate-independent phosphoglycerate mutase (AlkP superfamily)